MENASKALIIAGAILIAILLISVGIMVMNNMNKPLEQTETVASSQAVEIFNAKFTPFLGSGKTATEMKQLITTARSANVSITGKNSATLLENGKKYTASIPTTDGTDSNGKIKTIDIAEGT